MRLFVILIALTAAACATPGRLLIVKSEPAEAEVCIKGKAKGEHFTTARTCVGATPFEADRVEIVDPDGERRTIKFKDVESDGESFYVLVSRPGYATQAAEVPDWEHFIALTADASAPKAYLEKGSIRITSEPTGAVVYVDGAVKGNTPFTYEGAAGPIRLKLELEGYRPLEKVLTVEDGNALSVGFKLLTHKAAATETLKSVPVESAPIKVPGKKASGR